MTWDKQAPVIQMTMRIMMMTTTAGKVRGVGKTKIIAPIIDKMERVRIKIVTMT